MIEAIAMAYELGFKDPEEYFEIPGTWLTFDFDNHPGMELGIMTYTHGHNTLTSSRRLSWRRTSDSSRSSSSSRRPSTTPRS
jgi:hypothetical protein